MHKLFYTLALSFSLVLVSSHAQAAPRAFEEGMNALLEGNFAEAYCQWKPLAHRGYTEAQYNLAWLYANGNGLNVDVKQAIYWWKLAAEQGHADSQFAMGLAYTTGEGIKKDLEHATSWFIKAAIQGHIDARDILERLNLDPKIDLLASNPALLEEPWFGWNGSTKGTRINARSKPSTKSQIIAKLENGSPVRVVGRKGDWLQSVIEPEGSGPVIVWIYHTLVRRTN